MDRRRARSLAASVAPGDNRVVTQQPGSHRSQTPPGGAKIGLESRFDRRIWTPLEYRAVLWSRRSRVRSRRSPSARCEPSHCCVTGPGPCGALSLALFLALLGSRSLRLSDLRYSLGLIPGARLIRRLGSRRLANYPVEEGQCTVRSAAATYSRSARWH